MILKYSSVLFSKYSEKVSAIQEPFPLYPGETIEGAKTIAGMCVSTIQFLNIDFSVMFQHWLIISESMDKSRSRKYHQFVGIKLHLTKCNYIEFYNIDITLHALWFVKNPCFIEVQNIETHLLLVFLSHYLCQYIIKQIKKAKPCTTLW